MKILEDFLDKFESENRSKLNKAYLPSEVLEKLPKSSNKLVAEFVDVYKAKGNYKMLRTISPKDQSTTWDIIRNRELDKIKCDDDKLFKDNGEPTDNHLKMIYWAYSPQPVKVKAFYKVDSKSAGAKRQSEDNSSESSPAKKKR